MNNVIKLFEWIKKLLLWITKALYLFPIALSIFGFLFDEYSREGVLITAWFLALAFITWLLYIWIKNTEYIGFVCALAIYWALWNYTTLLSFFFLVIRKLLTHLIDIM
jgi:hypothetical protein